MEKKKVAAVVLSVGIGTFMSSLDSSAVYLVMPMIKNTYGVSLSLAEWVVTAYLLVISSLLLTFGRISDLYGHKRVYSAGYLLFLCGSLLCGISVNIGMLIASRVVQGLGAAMLYSTGSAIITNAVPAEKRGKALSVTAIAVALGLCAGPVIGGAVSTLFSWQSVFLINLPVGTAGILLAGKNIPADQARKPVPFDFVGSIMIILSLLLVLLPLNLSGDSVLPQEAFLAMISVGILLAIAFVIYEYRCEYPLFHTKLFGNRVFAASNAAAFFLYTAQFIMAFLAPFYLENVRGYSILLSGLLYLPMPIATMCIAPVSGGLSDRFGSRSLSSAGALLMSAGLFLLSYLNSDTTAVYIILSMLVTGVGFGMFQTPNNSAIMGSVPAQNRGTASGTLATMRNMGMVFGTAISGALFSGLMAKAENIKSALGATDFVSQNSAFAYALHLTFFVASGIAILAAAASYLKGRDRIPA